ncbi:TetR/AcrR family transcriptional regulator [Nocardia cyriacigeorgica]|uniref:TetR/AcrR family transcriptional regulator n=1 Tax=Nocardia cyriacigeorgica TaxID=135487 RepID=UPI002017EAD4|nr:TetR/AcrR family transcriptional regulator [Nocardia cyriacigeorgica]
MSIVGGQLAAFGRGFGGRRGVRTSVGATPCDRCGQRVARVDRVTSSGSPRVYDGRPVEDRRAERREQFLAAGLAVFGDQGYHGSSITGICKAAGLARAQFYEHFGNREELLLAVYDLIQTEARSAVVEALTTLDEEADAVTRASVAVRAYAESIGKDPRRARVSFAEIVGVSADVEKHRVEQREIWVEFFIAELKRARGPEFVPAGGFRAAATGFIGALMALVHQWSGAGSRAELEDLVEVLTRFLVSVM